MKGIYFISLLLLNCRIIGIAQISNHVEDELRDIIGSIERSVLAPFSADALDQLKTDSVSLKSREVELARLITCLEADYAKSRQGLKASYCNVIQAVGQIDHYLFDNSRSPYRRYEVYGSIFRRTYFKLLLNSVYDKLSIHSLQCFMTENSRVRDTLLQEISDSIRGLTHLNREFEKNLDRDSTDFQEIAERQKQIEDVIISLDSIRQLPKQGRLVFMDPLVFFPKNNRFGLSLSYLHLDTMQASGWGGLIGLQFAREEKEPANRPHFFLLRYPKVRDRMAGWRPRKYLVRWIRIGGTS
jgi:hypothetical protein